MRSSMRKSPIPLDAMTAGLKGRIDVLAEMCIWMNITFTHASIYYRRMEEELTVPKHMGPTPEEVQTAIWDRYGVETPGEYFYQETPSRRTTRYLYQWAGVVQTVGL